MRGYGKGRVALQEHENDARIFRNDKNGNIVRDMDISVADLT